ncbi:flavin reductase family protein [Pantoea sp. B65]|uniref:flavin reductase family protein n=1 Tax=Pantoea sp. B65 TaxID=2813359 RepID=UPI0039B57ED1
MQPTLDKSSVALTQEAFISAIGNCVTGVTVVATDGPGGQYGMTVSSMSSVSAEPPLLMICLHRSSLLCQAIAENRHFSVNVLSEEQKTVAQIFAGQVKTHDRFAHGDWSPGLTRSPRLAGAVACFECQLHSQFELGSHRVLVGEALGVQSNPLAPLAWQARQFVLVQSDMR